MNNGQMIVRELINEMLTPEEEREWQTHMASLPKHELLESREQFAASRAILLALVRLMDQGADPASDEVQRLMRLSNETLLKYHFRERLICRDRWNSTVARKIYALGHRIVTKMSASDSGRTEHELTSFCTAAHNASEWRRSQDALLSEAKALCTRRACPESSAVQDLCQRFEELCKRNSLGDPIVYARWYTEFGGLHFGDEWPCRDGEDRAAWGLLIDGIAVTRRSVN